MRKKWRRNIRSAARSTCTTIRPRLRPRRWNCRGGATWIILAIAVVVFALAAALLGVFG
jgi:hypothetical protein